MPQIGPAEIVVVLLVALLVFGPHKLPEVGRQVGRGMRELRKFQDAVKGEIDDVLHGVTSEGDAAPSTPPVETPPRAITAAPARPAPGTPGGATRAPSRFRATGAPARPEVQAAPWPPATPGRGTERGTPVTPARAPTRYRAPRTS